MNHNPIPDSLWQYLKHKYVAKDAQSVSGGSINEGAKFTTNEYSYFIKWNDASIFPKMFDLEAQNLTLLSSTCVVKTPRIIEFGEEDGYSFLILEFIKSGFRTYGSMKTLGEQLAELHCNTHSYFGLNYHNYLGILVQHNKRSDSWADFFIENRLKPLVNKAYHMHLLELEDVSKFVELYQKLPTLFPKEKPSLIHGDLWNGNFLISENETPFLIDPACYYGHRETDIAMTMLFGGFDRIFYESYQANFPMESGWQERVSIWNLYPLLTHLVLFGKSYRAEVVQLLSRNVA